MESEERLRELGKICNFETIQQRAERILKKTFDDLEKELEN